MTNLINQISINGQTTTFLNYINPVVGGELAHYNTTTITNLLTAHWGIDTTKWRVDNFFYFGDVTRIRFPTAFETKSGAIPAVSDGSTSRTLILGSTRCAFTQSGVWGISSSLTNTAAPISSGGFDSANLGSSSVLYGVINNNAIVLAAFTSTTRTTLSGLMYVGWNKEGIFSDTQYPRNLSWLSNTNGYRILGENNTSSLSLLSQNPTLSCSVATPGADSTDVIMRDSASPNNYIGKLWNMMILPSAAVVGKIYKNTGIDPDTGQVETDQKAFWMCVGTWGTDKIGMRVWTDNIA